MSAYKTKKWLDHLPDIIENYNTSNHSYHKTQPKEVAENPVLQLINRLRTMNNNEKLKADPKFVMNKIQEGISIVRIRKKTDEVFAKASNTYSKTPHKVIGFEKANTMVRVEGISRLLRPWEIGKIKNNVIEKNRLQRQKRSVDVETILEKGQRKRNENKQQRLNNMLDWINSETYIAQSLKQGKYRIAKRVSIAREANTDEEKEIVKKEKRNWIVDVKWFQKEGEQYKLLPDIEAIPIDTSLLIFDLKLEKIDITNNKYQLTEQEHKRIYDAIPKKDLPLRELSRRRENNLNVDTLINRGIENDENLNMRDEKDPNVSMMYRVNPDLERNPTHATEIGRELIAFYRVNGKIHWYSGKVEDINNEHQNQPKIRWCNDGKHDIDLNIKSYLTENEWKEFKDNKKTPRLSKFGVRWSWISKP
jgi:hypothetical protein